MKARRLTGLKANRLTAVCTGAIHCVSETGEAHSNGFSHSNGAALKRRRHSNPETGEAHRNGEAIETQKRAKPIKRHRHSNLETGEAHQTPQAFKSRNGRSP